MQSENIAIASLPLPLLLVDQNGRIQGVNVEAEAALGVSRKSLLGHSMRTLFAPESEIALMLERMRDCQEPLSVHGLHERANGGACSLHLGPASGGFVLLMVPESNRQELEQQSKKQEMAEAVARIALEVAHEVKNPLAALRGAAQWLSEQGLAGGQKEAVDMMLSEVDRIRERIDSFLQLGPRAPLGMEPVNIHTLIDEVCRPVDGVNLRRVYDPSLPPVLTHAGRLRQAIENLWRNAIEAGAHHIEWQTRVDPTVKLPGHKGPVLEVRISNDGEPVPQEIRGHVFEPFVTGKTRGSGLGLALVQRVMIEHNGKVTLRSAPGRTTFVLHLPIGSAA